MHAETCCALSAGRRKFGDFLSQYVAPVPGRLVDVGSGADLGACPNVLALTHGQRAGIGGAAGRCKLAVMVPCVRCQCCRELQTASAPVGGCP